MSVPDHLNRLNRHRESHRLRMLGSVAVGVLAWIHSAHADEVHLPLDQAAEVSSHEELISQIEQRLHSPRASIRRLASRQLYQLGAAAHPTMERMVAEGDPEAASRALRVLADSLTSQSSGVAESARRSLQRIAEAGGPFGVTAASILSQADEDQLLPENRFRVQQRKPLAPAVQRPAFANRPRNVVRVRIRSTNGKRMIQVEVSNKIFHFRDVDGGIEVERPDGKGGRKKVIYQNSADLAQRDAEAFDAYRRAGGDRAGGILRN